MNFEAKIDEFYQKIKLTSKEKKEFWKLVHEVKIMYNSVPKNLADKFGKIKASNTPWKLYSVRSGVIKSIITLTLGIMAWIWWCNEYIFMMSPPLTFSDSKYWIGLGIWIVIMFLAMEGTHELSHIIFAYSCKIKFNGWGSYKLSPTWDIEYSSYLQSTFNKRAWLHLIGALVNIIQYLAHLIITILLNINFILLLIPIVLVYLWTIWKGITEHYGDIPRFIKEIRRKRLYQCQKNQ